MKVFITGKGMVSPIGDGRGALNLPSSEGRWLATEKPDFNKYFDPKNARRTSKIIKMSLVAAFDALKNEYDDLDGIMVGTGIGCISDSEKFICSVLQYNEQMLSPTPFIQSTHNTIAASIAMKLKIHSYNITYSERIFSFEWTLLDALMKFSESESNQRYLVGAADELTERTFDMAKALNIADIPTKSLNKIHIEKTESIAIGEHAAFFTLSNKNNEKDTPVLEFVKLYFQQKANDVLHSLKVKNIQPDCLLLGINGHKLHDKVYDEIIENFPESNLMYFKHLSGESFTSSAFALYLATKTLEEQEIPEVSLIKKKSNNLKSVLIVNHFKRDYLSFIMIRI